MNTFGLWLQYSATSFYAPPHEVIWNVCLKSGKKEVFQACLGHLIAVIGNGGIVLLHGRDNTRCCIDHRCFQTFIPVKHPSVTFEVNGGTYSTGYYLADGIYPPLATLVTTISAPVGQKRKYFAEKQEPARKDVERTFGVLMARFAIVKTPARSWNKDDLNSVMRTCIILRNMIIEDEREDAVPSNESRDSVYEVTRPDDTFAAFLNRYKKVHDTRLHHELQNDLIEYLWNMKGDDEFHKII
ncbi:uncharacterized protein LOC129773965 [Toxorhynchites rutilus septentrionalis]|uniref:uncharacterized protein LOC129773965 n=1 Tax=Toxorhynchites rutilus septentrionalis TaxID=329112 RepID=UPI00247A50C3|nr:uncharacterized protein LOC129773965 [Toxorhynchites rutilus septentrionalis]